MNDSGEAIKRRKKNHKRVSQKKVESLFKTRERTGETIGRIVVKIAKMNVLIVVRTGKMKD